MPADLTVVLADGIKWAGGSFSLVPSEQVKACSDIAHDHGAYVSSGGWIETVLRYGDDPVDQYLKEAKNVGFDVIEISTGFIMLNTSGLIRLVEKVVKAGLKAKPELGIQIGSGGDSGEAELAAETKRMWATSSHVLRNVSMRVPTSS